MEESSRGGAGYYSITLLLYRSILVVSYFLFHVECCIRQL